MAGCGGDRDTERKVVQAWQPAPDSSLSSHIQAWANTAASADKYILTPHVLKDIGVTMTVVLLQTRFFIILIHV